MKTILFYFLIILALAGSSYYGQDLPKVPKIAVKRKNKNVYVVFSCLLMSSFLRAF